MGEERTASVPLLSLWCTNAFGLSLTTFSALSCLLAWVVHFAYF
jgi:hypothetical protein